MPILDWSFLDPLGRAVIATIETVISLSAITSLLSLSAALVATWVMQVTPIHQARLGSSKCPTGAGAAHRARRARDLPDAQCRDTVHHADPSWLANPPLLVAIMVFLLAFGLSHIRAERARAGTLVGSPEPENILHGRLCR